MFLLVLATVGFPFQKKNITSFRSKTKQKAETKAVPKAAVTISQHTTSDIHSPWLPGCSGVMQRKGT